MKDLIAQKLQLKEANVSSVINLLEDGSTIPFIARYRKEVTGSLDEIAIENISKELLYFKELEKRKETIFDRLKELVIKDSILIQKITNCYDSKELEDLYLPYKPKRKTRAMTARKQGLEPLAKIIMSQNQNDIIAQSYRFAKNGLSSDEALQGARDIISEWVSESIAARNQVRRTYKYTAVIVSKVVAKKKIEAIKYKDYFDFSQALHKIPSHRLLALLRAEKEGFLKVKVDIDNDEAEIKLDKIFIKSHAEAAEQIKLAIRDSLKRLLIPSINTEAINEAKEKADKEAIDIFSNNLSQLLLSPPLGAKNILALDPGFRTGCKLVCLNKQANLQEHGTIFPHPPLNKKPEAEQKILSLIKKYNIEAIAIGNGTAGRETDAFIKSILPKDSIVEVYLISESGASIYSASEAGREEFPDLDLTVRGSISIGRRLVDPLAELVKIEPKNIGVGQYQHDVAQDKLKLSLDNTVSFAVNKVGVNLNTASKHLLKYVSGIGPKLAENIINHRKVEGIFSSRKELLKVKGLGNKAYEQAAGFLRITNGKNPLDASAVHPESYHIVKSISSKSGKQIEELIGNKVFTSGLNLEDYTTPTIGLPTLKDIVEELNKPGLDPRGAAKAMKFDDTIREIKDLHVGMILPGKVTNLTKFGAFVDIGIKENGLIHKSQIADRYIEDPAEVLKLDQEVKVKILEVDLDRKRVALSMKF